MDYCLPRAFDTFAKLKRETVFLNLKNAQMNTEKLASISVLTATIYSLLFSHFQSIDKKLALRLKTRQCAALIH